MSRSTRVVLGVAMAWSAAGCEASRSEVHADLCTDLHHLERTIVALASPDPATRIGVVRGDLERLDPTFGNASRSELADPVVLDRLLQAHVDYRDQFRSIGDDAIYEVLGPAAPAAGRELQRAFEAIQDDLGCGDAAVEAIIPP